jgi:hypothetical protein
LELLAELEVIVLSILKKAIVPFSRRKENDGRIGHHFDQHIERYFNACVGLGFFNCHSMAQNNHDERQNKKRIGHHHRNTRRNVGGNDLRQMRSTFAEAKLVGVPQP